VVGVLGHCAMAGAAKRNDAMIAMDRFK